MIVDIIRLPYRYDPWSPEIDTRSFGVGVDLYTLNNRHYTTGARLRLTGNPSKFKVVELHGRHCLERLLLSADDIDDIDQPFNSDISMLTAQLKIHDLTTGNTSIYRHIPSIIAAHRMFNFRKCGENLRPAKSIWQWSYKDWEPEDALYEAPKVAAGGPSDVISRITCESVGIKLRELMPQVHTQFGAGLYRRYDPPEPDWGDSWEKLEVMFFDEENPTEFYRLIHYIDQLSISEFALRWDGKTAKIGDIDNFVVPHRKLTTEEKTTLAALFAEWVSCTKLVSVTLTKNWYEEVFLEGVDGAGKKHRYYVDITIFSLCTKLVACIL